MGCDGVVFIDYEHGMDNVLTLINLPSISNAQVASSSDAELIAYASDISRMLHKLHRATARNSNPGGYPTEILSIEEDIEETSKSESQNQNEKEDE